MIHFKNIFLLLVQYLLPHRLISKIFYIIANSHIPWFKNFIIRKFIENYKINLKEYDIENYYEYKSFNDFFTRSLEKQKRLKEPYNFNIIIFPSDGLVTQYGRIENDMIIQAKNHRYSALELLAYDIENSDKFTNGSFINIYLSPKNYHRIHMPFDGNLKKIVYVPGKIFSVNPFLTEKIPNLFARNERVICFFETVIGPMAVILVGAMIVSSIETVWTGLIRPKYFFPKITTLDIKKNSSCYKRIGEEIGRFQLGSTVIVLFGINNIQWQKSIILSKSQILFGQPMAKIIN